MLAASLSCITLGTSNLITTKDGSIDSTAEARKGGAILVIIVYFHSTSRQSFFCMLSIACFIQWR